MNGSENPYEILGVSPDADEAAIKKAYHQAARIHHPDMQTTDEDRERGSAYFAKIADAYSLLQDPVRRYDWRMSNGDKQERSPQYPSSSSPSKSTKSTATMNHRVPSTSLNRQSTPSVSTSGPERRSSNQTTVRTNFAPEPRMRRRHSINTTECNQSPPVARKPAGNRKAMRRSSLGGNTVPPFAPAPRMSRRHSINTTECNQSPPVGNPAGNRKAMRRSSLGGNAVPPFAPEPRMRRRHSINATECKQSPPVARKPASIRKTMRRSSLGGNTIPQRSMTNKENRSPRPEAGRKTRSSQSVPSTNKKLERKLSGASTESKRKGRTSARPSLDTKSQHTSGTVKSEQVPKQSKFSRARKSMRGWSKRSVSESTSSTISMKSADYSIPTSLDTKSQHTSRTVKSDQVPKQSKFGRARKLMRSWSKKSVSTENTSSTISMRSADNSIP
jgi:curved DNA-binding protein CbpA